VLGERGKFQDRQRDGVVELQMPLAMRLPQYSQAVAVTAGSDLSKLPVNTAHEIIYPEFELRRI
jgi:hypothetical protein